MSMNTSKHGLNYHSNCTVLLLPSNGISTVGTVLEGCQRGGECSIGQRKWKKF